VIASLALVLLMQDTLVPSSGNVLANKASLAPVDPAYPTKATPQQVKIGEDLYNVHCASCHGLNLQGGPEAPPLIGIDAQDADFMLRTGRMPAEIPFEEETHKAPRFNADQIVDIVDYVMSKASGEKMLPVVKAPDFAVAPPGMLKKGREVYEENCEHCHAATGRGDGVGYANVAPELSDATPEEIAEAVRMGPDVMPVFGKNIISDDDLNALITYVGYLQRGKYNPGGLQLANWGPVSEGFICWTFGIGLLVLLVRRIGTVE
jgi:ubiquinol-cytochrome c reductase cytochrome c subunit